MTDQRTPPANETSDPSQHGLKFHSALILNAVNSALQIPSDSCVPTCQRSSGSNSARYIAASSRPFTTELRQEARKPWQPPVVEESQPSSKEC